jgi:hypothetical protein
MTRPASDLTVFETEPVTIPDYIVAASAILRLAQGFFYAIEFAEEFPGQQPLKFTEAIRIWRVLRRASRLLLERGALELSLAEACELREALKKCPPGRDVDFLRGLEFNERG